MSSCLEEKVAAPVSKAKNTAEGIRHADHYSQMLALTWPTRSSRSVGIVHSRTQVMEFSLLLFLYFNPEDIGDLFLRNGGLSPNYKVLHLSRSYSS
jgi:hypothetical protein